MGWCECLSGVHYFFRFDWNDGTFRTTDTELADADLARVRDTMVAYVNAMPALANAARSVRVARAGSIRSSRVILTNDSYVMLFDERMKRPQLVVFVVARDVRNGMPVELYGYVTDPEPFLRPVFAELRGVHGSSTAVARSAGPRSADRFDPFDLGHDGERKRGLPLAGMDRADLQRASTRSSRTSAGSR